MCLIGAAAGESSLLQLMESDTPSVPSGWTSVGPTPRQQKIELHFAVKQRNVEQLHDALMQVSTPSSPDYGMHLSKENVHKLTAPNPEHIAAVVSFLTSHGAEVSMQTENSDMIAATVPVEVAERILSAKYVEMAHEKSGVTVHRTPDGYSLPLHVAAAVDFVSPTVHIPGVRRFPELLQSPNATFGDLNTPTNLRKLYNVGDAEGKAPKNKQAVTAFLKQYYSQADLASWWKQYCKGLTCGKGLPTLIGDATTGSAGIEAMLDIETITGVAGNIDSEFWGFGGNSPDNPENEPFMKWLTKLSQTSDADVPKLFSTSYGEDESSWSLPAATRLNTEFMKAGARGISLLYASGDEGANCKSDKYVPEGPGSSPYVTAVGGTQPADGFPNPGSESAIGLSSGGFSGYWAMPDWQKTAVNQYLSQSGLPKKSLGYNTSGRAYPDIAAQATNFCVNPGGCGVAGTSCASPTAGALFSLLNDLRLQNGKSSLGFLNPLIYSNAAAFNDITTGSSSGCLFSEGWPAKTGWDAVTGVGTPDYGKLAKVIAELPSGKAQTTIVV